MPKIRRNIYWTMTFLHIICAIAGFVFIYDSIYYYEKSSILTEKAIAVTDQSERFLRSIYIAEGRGIAAMYAAYATACFTLSSLLFLWSRGLKLPRS